MSEARMVREEGGTWGVTYRWRVVLSGESYQVAANLQDALNKRGPIDCEAAEVAEAIERA